MHHHRRVLSHTPTVPPDTAQRIPAEPAEPAPAGPPGRYRHRVRYVHYCEPCDARSPERATDHEAKTDRAVHRRRAHHGLRPADRIEEIPGPLSIAVSALLSALGHAARTGARQAATSEALRQVRASPYWQQAVRLLAIGTGVLVLGAVIARHLG
ncbi:hypothetical protein [Streptomyces lydicus]|uniref:hypothetical protein n=1 Tax=Streptomyces lydicus TaxID=47763 RepID=UPI0013E96506|nr:hypothetical protein [Streptomyces lydicus]